MTLELILIFSILVIGTLVGVIAVRNAIFQLITAKAQFQVEVKDSADPPLRVRPVNYDLCEAPQILCRDPGTGVDPDPEGLFALVGIRPERFVSRDRVYFTTDNCTGTPLYLAAPNDSTLPVGYLNALQGVSYAVGPPDDWPCIFGSTCSDVGQLYRSSTTAAAGGTIIRSVWTSLNPDCYLFSGGTDPVVYSTPPELCEDLTVTLSTFDGGARGLLEAQSVDEMGVNVLDKFTPLMSVMAPTVTEVTVTDAAPEGAPLQTGGDPITETGQPDMTDAAPESAPPQTPP